MALLTGISGAVRANVAGMAGRAVKSASSTVKSIAGLNPEGSNSSLDTIAKTTRTGSYSILTYPLNVDNDPQMGHYILFNINTRTNPKIKSTRERKSIHDAARKVQKEMSIATGDEFAGLTQLGTTALDKVDPTKLSDAKGASGKLNRSIVLEKLPTSRLEKSIALYMHPSVQVEYKVGYGDQEVGVLAMAGMAAIEGFKGGGDTQTKLRNAINAATPGVKEALNAMAEKTIDNIAEGAATLMAIERGTVRTPRM